MSASEKINILLVDDQPGKLLSYEVILSSLGENLIKARSGREALEQLLKHDVTIVLMDVSMPDLDGFELAKIMRQHPRYEKTAIIFVSAVHLTDLDRLKGYESGAVDYVSVPVVPEILRAKVSVFAELFRKTREWERLNRDLEHRVAERTAELEANMVRQAEMADQLVEADRRKDEFLALLSHELRNPLAPLRSALDIMRVKPIADTQLLWCRDVIERQALQLMRLVDDLLDVSRITHGKIKLRMEPIDLATVVARAVETSRPLIDSRGHELTLTLPDEPVRIEGDMARLTQIVANLLNNAAKYQQEHGHIELTVIGEPTEAVIRVKDHGLGIPPEMLSRVFELFSQGERGPDGVQGGLGIGLSLVQNLVGMHGGRVRAFSDGLGQGSEFVIWLPRLPNQPERSGVEQEGVGAVPDVPPRRVLVVDDSRDAAESLAALLRLAGHEVRVALDGIDAVEIAVAERPEVVLLDIGLPGLDGYEVCRRLRQQGLSDALIIAMTGYGREKDRLRSKEAGFDAHTVKPAQLGDLLGLLAHASTPSAQSRT